MSYVITIDTGGTFTDAIIQDDDGRLTVGKALTTAKRAFEGMYGAIAAAAGLLEVTPEHVIRKASRLIFGTTRPTNAMVIRSVVDAPIERQRKESHEGSNRAPIGSWLRSGPNCRSTPSIATASRPRTDAGPWHPALAHTSSPHHRSDHSARERRVLLPKP
jgi:hypothetical protein